MSNLKVNTINDASGGSNAVLYGVAAPVGSMGFRNRIINGEMRIDQRNAGASVTPSTGTYTIDRWQGFGSQASKFTVQQNAGSVTPPAGYTNYLGCTSSSAYTVGSSEVFMVRQFIEGYNVADLGWGAAGAQTVTLSFWVRSSLTGTFGGCLQNDNALSNRSYPFSYTISAANTWEQKTVTVAGDTTGTWRTTTAAGITATFSLGAGSTLSGTAGTWAGANYLSATGATSVVGTSGATFYITGVQLEAGSVASPFERRDYGRELMMCQRYLTVYGPGAVFFATGNYYISTLCFCILNYNMRSTPTLGVTAADITIQTNGLNLVASSVAIGEANLSSMRLDVTTSAATAGNGGNARLNASGKLLLLSAEL
jgi:hypothetical protein